jgi:multiple sugar transport system permease protein/putative chitobiose transport system permease protein
MAIFLLRQFFLEIPRDLVDAARVDGANWFTIYRKIYIPLSKPALIGAALILFIFEWEAYLWPLLIVTRSEMDVAPVALVKVVTGRFYTEWGQMFAGAVILAAIPALFLLPLQRYFTHSIKSTGLRE